MASNKSAIDTKLIRELADLLNETDLGEIEVEEGDLRIRLARGSETAFAYAPQPIAAPAVPMPTPEATAPAATGAPAPAGVSGNAITSPMVGTAYHSPSPGTKAFVAIGDTVKSGQTVMIVEAMKTMNQISATQDGVIASIEVEDGQPVEFGQVLVTLK